MPDPSSPGSIATGTNPAAFTACGTVPEFSPVTCSFPSRSARTCSFTSVSDASYTTRLPVARARWSTTGCHAGRLLRRPLDRDVREHERVRVDRLLRVGRRVGHEVPVGVGEPGVQPVRHRGAPATIIAGLAPAGGRLGLRGLVWSRTYSPPRSPITGIATRIDQQDRDLAAAAARGRCESCAYGATVGMGAARTPGAAHVVRARRTPRGGDESTPRRPAPPPKAPQQP
jgi:hypothetical protein